MCLRWTINYTFTLDLILMLIPVAYPINYLVNETVVKIEPITFTAMGVNTPPIKLTCRGSSNIVNYIWDYVRCGEALALTPCDELYSEVEWQSNLCGNGMKPCLNPVHTIKNPTELDSGLYRCLEKNYMVKEDIFLVNKMYQLQIKDQKSPSMEVLQETHYHDHQRVIENSSVVFRCRIRSIHPPHILWLRETEGYLLDDIDNSKLLLQGKHYGAVNNTSYHGGFNKSFTLKLHLYNVQASDSGTYVCYAYSYVNLRNYTKRVRLRVTSYSEITTQQLGNRDDSWIIALIPAFVILVIALLSAFVLCCSNTSDKKVLLPSYDESSTSLQC